MKKTNMLKKNYEFRNVLNTGKYYGGKHIEIFIKKNNMKVNLLGIAISRKIGSSVTRNKIKRLIRENYYLLEKNLKVGNSLVVLWKKNISSELASFDNISEDMKNIFIKANLFIK